MAQQARRQGDLERLRITPVGSAGLDLRTTPTSLRPDSLAQSEFVRLGTRACARALGARAVTRSTHLQGSLEFLAGGSGKVLHAAQLDIPEGGFALRFTVSPVTLTPGQTAFVWSNRVSGQTYGSLWPTIADDGVLSVSWRAQSGATIVATSAPLHVNVTSHVWALFDQVLGTFTIYVNGAASGVPATGIAANDYPVASTSDWYWGAEYDPGTTSFDPLTQYLGKIDACALLALRGQRLDEGSPTLLSQLLRLSYQKWPAPQDPRVLFCYDFNQASGDMLDVSKHKNHMVLSGSIARHPAIALRAAPVNAITILERAGGEKHNVLVSSGDVYHQKIRNGA